MFKIGIGIIIGIIIGAVLVFGWLIHKFARKI